MNVRQTLWAEMPVSRLILCVSEPRKSRKRHSGIQIRTKSRDIRQFDCISAHLSVSWNILFGKSMIVPNVKTEKNINFLGFTLTYSYLCGMKRNVYSYMCRTLSVGLLCGLVVGQAFGQAGHLPVPIPKELQEAMDRDRNICGCSYLAYPVHEDNLPTLTRAPRGYKPFYISHYGRHGSRWLTSAQDYDYPVEVLRKGSEDGMLTPQGRNLLAQLETIQKASQKRTGELTPLGTRQHRDIAHRMVRNFPKVFGSHAHVDCKSSTVMRCALSMMNEASELRMLRPHLSVSTDASAADMWYIAPPSDPELRSLEREAREGAIADFDNRHTHVEHLMGELFESREYVRDSVDVKSFVAHFSRVVANQQSHDTDLSFWSLLNAEESQEIWLRDNAQWYLLRGLSPLTQGRMPEVAHTLLQRIVEQADSVINSGGRGATLRFGHDSNLMPLVVLLELNGSAAVIEDMEDVARQGWMAHQVVPMAGNVQLIFYRSRRNPEVLVKALLCEQEATLPVSSDLHPYYRWSELHDYYLRKLGIKNTESM